ncbi:hypothetical protein CDCA_CDCA06G1798 [Cyanidium caldarium]|uniref:Serine/threonine-protein phosphatase 2A 55 kDa regulatory subunit B n=1 Tax=Cyanidium caldarium TaxID=2771 RepID=A0AAV9IVB7_CYACA|nr:hypothetical protein CDCA_CDCA06G1798 [Cyanidium caldarium]
MGEVPQYRFAQAFGERTTGEPPQEADLISAVEFSRTGDFVATGDKGGRVVILQRVDAGRGWALRREQVARAQRRQVYARRAGVRRSGSGSSAAASARSDDGRASSVPTNVPRSPRIAVSRARWTNGHDVEASDGRRLWRDRPPHNHALGDAAEISEMEDDERDESLSSASELDRDERAPDVSNGDLELTEGDVMMSTYGGGGGIAAARQDRHTPPPLRLPLDGVRERAHDGRNGLGDGNRDDERILSGEDDRQCVDDDDDDDAATWPLSLVGDSGAALYTPEYRFWTQFQSHEPEFDYLKSLEIEEKINQVRWCRDVSGAHRLLTTNDKTIKLWRVYEKQVLELVRFDNPTQSTRSDSSSSFVTAAATGGSANTFNHHRGSAPAAATPASALLPTSPLSSDLASAGSLGGTELRLPKLRRVGSVITAVPKRVFANAHAYHINSISLNSDEETFLSADDLRINLWRLDICTEGFNVVDIKPDNMEELTEVITAAEFHPRHCNLFVYSSSKGILKLCDLRTNALCDCAFREFYQSDEAGGGERGFFSEIIASTSDLAFAHSGRYVLARDYMSLRVWDLAMNRQPLLTVPVHESLRPRLCELYENDYIFDKFQCTFSADDQCLLTGSYGNQFHTYSTRSGQGLCVEASVDFVSTGLPARVLRPDGVEGTVREGDGAGGDGSAASARAPRTDSLTSLTDAGEANAPNLPLNHPASRRVLHLASHPLENIAAVAAGPALYIYHASGNRGR